MTRRILYSVILAASFAGVLMHAQQAPPELPAAAQAGQPPLTFRVEANFVEVDAFVSDATGKPITDLRAGDFQLLEDGKPQMVSAFSYVNIPVARAERPLFSPTAIEPDVDTNVGMDGRIYVFVLDDLHVDLTRGPRVKEALHRFFERNFGANDLAAVVYTGGRSVDGQDFTNSPRLLLAAVDKFMGRKLRSPTLERLDEYNRQQTAGTRNAGDPVNDPAGFERAQNARSLLQSLQKLSDFMSGLHGRRKALVLVSEGIDYDIYNLFDNNSSASTIIDATRDAIAAATRGNVSIYAIDPRGLAVPGAELIETSGVAADEPNLGLGIQSAMNELRLSQDSLRELADETGGFASVNRNNVDEAFDRLVSDNSSYYVLGYNPANDRRDGRFRKIEVRVTRPGVTVRARRGYVAPRGRPAATAKASNDPGDAALKAAVESPLPTTGIPMRLFAAAYKGAPPNAAITLAIELNVNALKFTEKNGAYTDALSVVTVVADNDGKTRVNEKASVDLNLMPATLARARERGFRITSAVNLPPGRYQLRVSAADATGIAGSVVRTLVVPDFYKPPLVMSGLTLLSASGVLAPTARVKEDPVGQLLMRPPTTAREFTRDDQLVAFAEIYENDRNTPAHKIDLTTEVRAEGGRVVFSNSEERASTELQGGRGGYGYTAQIPLKDFAPGLYVVHVEGKRRDGNIPAVARDVQIRIR
ncbi:MAG TPA: VWA domain-containing protein [Vicinamibacterales bacterium]|jgi:VWFA-related protein